MKLSDPTTVIETLAAGRTGARTTGILAVFPRTAALVLLLIGITLEQPAIDIGVLTVKPEHLFLVFLWLAVGWRFLSTRLLQDARLLLWIIPYLAVLLLASLLNSPEPGTSLRHTVMVALVASAAWLAYGLLTRDSAWRWP